MATKTVRHDKKKTGSKSFNMRIPWTVWEQIETAAAKRGISVAALMLSATTKEIGVA